MKQTMSSSLEHFVSKVTAILARDPTESALLEEVSRAMTDLIARDDWLPAELATPHPEYYQQYLLYCDPGQRFSVVSFVWGPGQQTPIHNHTVWGVIGVLRGAEISESFQHIEDELVASGEPVRLMPGDVAMVSPTIGDIHRVKNAYDDQVSISIHVYGADIGRQSRHAFDPLVGSVKRFISGYANAVKAMG